MADSITTQEDKDKLKLPVLKAGDTLMVGKFKNRKAEITGFDKDKHGQPVAKTDKGDQQIFKGRVAKLMPEAFDPLEWKDDILEGILDDPWLESPAATTSAQPRESKFSFIQGELTEARYLRIPRDAAGSTQADIAETFFEHVLMFQQMRYEDPQSAQDYAKETMRFRSFDKMKPGATDLHNLAAILNNPEEYDDVTGDDRVTPVLPINQFRRYLSDTVRGDMNPSQDRQFLYKLEKQLFIGNSILRRLRRIAQDYSMSTPGERKQMASRLFLHFKQDQRYRSDLFKAWSKFAKNLAINPEDIKMAQEKGFKVPGWAKWAAAIAAAFYAGHKAGKG